MPFELLPDRARTILSVAGVREAEVVENRLETALPTFASRNDDRSVSWLVGLLQHLFKNAVLLEQHDHFHKAVMLGWNNTTGQRNRSTLTVMMLHNVTTRKTFNSCSVRSRTARSKRHARPSWIETACVGQTFCDIANSL